MITLKQLQYCLPKYHNNISKGGKANEKLKVEVAVEGDISKAIKNQDEIPSEWWDKKVVSIEPIVTSCSRYGAKTSILILLQK